MKKLNLKQPKYIFPLVVFLPLTFLAYEVSSMFDGNSTTSAKVATDSLNMELPDADNQGMKDKMTSMGDRGMGEDGYSAIDGLGNEEAAKDSSGNGYSESEMDQIDKDNADRIAQQKAQEEMERSLAESRKHINAYANSGYGRSHSGGYSRKNSRRDELDDYVKELEYIQRRSQAAQRAIDAGSGNYGGNSIGSYRNYDDPYSESYAGNGRSNRQIVRKSKKSTEKVQTVEKVNSPNADRFNTVSATKNIDAPLIKAMIDKTTKAHEGTRLRFKLLDDVTINKVLLKKGTYLYGLVTGFGQQRVRANITSILVGSKFIKVNLSVYDNDGMEGFYVPESAFRDMMKEAGAQAMQQNMQFGNNYGSTMNGESVALQALQNIYQSASNAVSANMRKNKARIKYNTIVYLINTSAEE
ncbi:conjugative transposon protein TraM [Prevotella brunnea]|uniref:conjugative transposon protein TraM n=1 Tax=Prevotella brunnea TaxID=2508867 RepID=UPI00281F47B3|nr:conjugative transposon protein TraM [Prevotella brunnea]MDR0185316.1 conjugative transposon protein TraM [Prevotella brunnea]